MAGVSIECGTCGLSVAGKLVGGDVRDDFTAWFECPSCFEGSVRLRNGVVYPTRPAGGAVAHLPVDVEQAWKEARTSHSVAAYTASEIMCRKILMHVAVDVAQAKPGKQFVDYVDHLEAAGYITTGLKGTIDKIRQAGNAANHELPASTKEDSIRTLEITEYLLRGAYELAHG